MKKSLFVISLAVCTIAVFCAAQEKHSPVSDNDRFSLHQESEPIESANDCPTTVAEARSRARLLHEVIHGILQVMHRDFFRKEESTRIPSRSLEDVFETLEKEQQINLHWLAVDTKAMSIDHEAKTEIEKEAVEHLKKREGDFEKAFETQFVFAGSIRLSAVCLSCHLPGRSSNDDRFAGLMISLPIREQAEKDKE